MEDFFALCEVLRKFMRGKTSSNPTSMYVSNPSSIYACDLSITSMYSCVSSLMSMYYQVSPQYLNYVRGKTSSSLKKLGWRTYFLLIKYSVSRYQQTISLSLHECLSRTSSTYRTFLFLGGTMKKTPY